MRLRLPYIQAPYLRRSKHNGWILVTARGEVWVGGIKQTSLRYDDLWMDAFAHSESLLKVPVSKVLLLGLAGGGALLAVYGAYPEATVTAVEFDPVMVDIAKDLHKDKPYAFPAVLIADAKEALLQLDQSYDLILVDIFSGEHPSKHIDDDQFWSYVAARLCPGGVAILNVAIQSTRMYVAQNHFKSHAAWRYDSNYFCALSNS